MAEVKFYKLGVLPGTLEANAVYFIENGSYAEHYVTNSAGVAKMVGNTTMINALISTQLSGLNSTEIVANIAARDALGAGLNRNTLVYVIDATGDGTVISGAASYLFNNSNDTWIKISEFESLDAAVSWSNVSGKPTSTPGAIDAAVTNSHTHTNKAQLDLINVDGNGAATYNGDQIKNWNTVNW
jgi:uncharacterized protein (UPF0212 family)